MRSPRRGSRARRCAEPPDRVERDADRLVAPQGGRRGQPGPWSRAIRSRMRSDGAASGPRRGLRRDGLELGRLGARRGEQRLSHEHAVAREQRGLRERLRSARTAAATCSGRGRAPAPRVGPRVGGRPAQLARGVEHRVGVVAEVLGGDDRDARLARVGGDLAPPARARRRRCRRSAPGRSTPSAVMRSTIMRASTQVVGHEAHERAPARRVVALRARRRARPGASVRLVSAVARRHLEQAGVVGDRHRDRRGAEVELAEVGDRARVVRGALGVLATCPGIPGCPRPVVGRRQRDQPERGSAPARAPASASAWRCPRGDRPGGRRPTDPRSGWLA